MALKLIPLLVFLQVLSIQASEVCDGPGGDRVLCPQLSDDLDKGYCCPPGSGEICCVYEDRYEGNDYGGGDDYDNGGGDYGPSGETNPTVIYVVLGVLGALILACIGACCYCCKRK